MKIVRTCDCGRTESLELSDEEYNKYREWRRGERYIQEIGTLNAVEREFVKTGLCRKCQKEIFNNDKSERLKVERN